MSGNKIGNIKEENAVKGIEGRQVWGLPWASLETVVLGGVGSRQAAGPVGGWKPPGHRRATEGPK